MENFYTAFKKPVSFVLLAILLGGGYCYTKIKTSLFPDITFPKIKIIADAGLQPVDRMMITVTRPLENAVKQVPDLKMIHSTTSRGSCEISAFMDWQADVDRSRLQVESRISQIKDQLPAGTQITVEKMSPSILPVIGYSLESSTRSLIDLKYLAVYVVKPFLSQVEGVSAVNVLGGKEREFRLTLEPQKMSSLGITPDMLQSALAQTGSVNSNGFLNDFRRMYLSITDASLHDRHDLENLVIRNDGKRIIHLGDIARVTIAEAVEYVKINANGKEGVLVNVVRQPEANLIAVTDSMQHQLADLQKLLPTDVSIRPYYLQAEFVGDSIHSVKDALWIGLALAILVALIFLRSLRAGATLLIIIPVTLGFTLIVLYTLGYTFNIMTLGALVAAIGLIIDDAVVIVEQIHRTHEEHPERASGELVHQAIRYLLPAMIGSSLSTIVIFLPFGLMSGVAGAYFHIMTNTMMLTLICSFFITWIGVPIVYLLLSGKEGKERTSTQDMAAHTVTKQRWVDFFTHRPWISIVFLVLLAGVVVYIYPRLQTGFLPEMDEGSIVLDFTSPAGTSLGETDNMLQQVDAIVRQTPEVAAFSRRTGAQMGFFITEPNRGDYLIELKKDRSKGTEEVIDAIRRKVEAKVPGLIVDFGQVIGDMLGDLTTSVQPVEIKVFGNDHRKLRELSRHIADLIEHVQGTADVFDGTVIAGPSIDVLPDYVKLAQYGLTPANVQSQLQTTIEGSIAGGIFNGEYLSNIRIVQPYTYSMSAQELRDMNIFLPNGHLLPLHTVAHVELHQGDAEIERENLQNVAVITARLSSRDLGSVMKDIQHQIASDMTLPQGYHIEYGGAYLQQQQSFKELLSILIIASLLVFGVILFLFREWKASLIILFISVAGIAGGYLALFITSTPLNVGSYTGLIMIVGIIGENAIFTYLQYQKALEEYGDVYEAITYSISTRLRPKLMTAVCAIVAMMPLALGIGTGSQLHQPLAIAVIGGFIVALPLLLIVLPGLLRLGYRRNHA